MTKKESIGIQKEKINDLISRSNYVVYYDTESTMNTKELITRIFDKRSRLKELGFTETEIFRVIFETDSLKNYLLEDNLFDQLVEYYRINVP